MKLVTIPRVAALALVSLTVSLPTLSYATTISTYEIKQTFQPDPNGYIFSWNFYVSLLDGCTVCSTSDMTPTMFPTPTANIANSSRPDSGADASSVSAVDVTSLNLNNNVNVQYTLASPVSFNWIAHSDPAALDTFNGTMDINTTTSDFSLQNTGLVDTFTGDSPYAESAPILLGTFATLISQVTSPQCPAVPLPASTWLFGSGLLGLIGVARRKARS